jgi:integrase
MKLQDLVETYIAFKGSLGMRYRSQSAVLRAYCRAMGDIDIEDVRPDAVRAFIAGTGPVTNRWLECYRVLDGLYRYAIARGFAKRSPLPTDTPRHPRPYVPYIYTADELKRLVAATDILQTPLSPMLAQTMRSLLLLLYGTGMRIGEALSLTLQDVDLKSIMITVRDAKFLLRPRNSWVVSHYRYVFFDRCSAQVQAYPPSLPVGKPTCLSLAHKLACPQVRSTRWVSRVRTLVYLPVFPASRNLYSLRQVASRES